MAAGLDPTAVIGGRVNSLGLANARWGKSDYLVAEADESDGSFLTLTPTVAIVTNVDAEHLDHYGTFDNVKKAFIDFCNRVPFYGMSALCLDNAGVQAILPQRDEAVHDVRHLVAGDVSRAQHPPRRPASRGSSRGAAPTSSARSCCRCPARTTCSTRSACSRSPTSSAIPFETYVKALAQFEGVARRFTVRGEVGGITVVDDFGHHPAEVRATLVGREAPASPAAASSPRSSRTGSRARAISWTSSRARSTTPTRS